MEKKLISLIIALIMLVSVVPMAVFATDDLPESNGKIQEWTYEAKPGKKSLRITFDDYHGEDEETSDISSDVIKIYDRNGTLRFSCSCNFLFGKTIDINSDYIRINYKTDENYIGDPCGFKITKIDEFAELGSEINVLCDENGNVTEDKSTGTVTFSPVGESGVLNFEVVGNVDWVKHIVVEESFTTMWCAFNNFVNATSFDLPDDFEIYANKLDETAFYKDKANWENESLYLGTRLIKLGSKDEIKDGTTELCYDSINHRENIFIPNSVKKVDSQYNVKNFLCDEGSQASGLLEEMGMKVYFPGALKVKFTSSVINSGTPLSKAIEVFKLNNKHKWEKITAYSASGYFANKVGENQLIEITSSGNSIAFNIVLSDADHQYINFSDEELSNEIHSDLGIDGNSLISVDMLGEFSGYISLYNVSDISGLEYINSANNIYSFEQSFIPLEDYFSLQVFYSTRLMEGETRYSSEYSQLDMEGLNGYAKYTLSDDSIASIDENGVITGKKSGEAVVTVSVEDVSKTFKISVYSTDAPAGIKSDKVPSIVAGNLVNTADGDIYQIVGSNAKIEETDTKVVMSSDYIVGDGFAVYTGYYYLTDNSELWVASTRRGSTMKMGDGYKKVCENSKLALKNDGSCWNLETRNQLESHVYDICGNFYITPYGGLYFVGDRDEITLLEKDATSIISCDSNHCFYTKIDGKTYVAEIYFGEDSTEFQITKCADSRVTDICLYRSYYYYTDTNNVLYCTNGDGQETKLCSDVVEIKDGYFVTKDKNVFMASMIKEDKSGTPYFDTNSPSLKNVEKITGYFYIDSNNNLYTSWIYKTEIIYAVQAGRSIPKFMSNVVDVKEAAYYDGDNYVQYALITRTDGSVWCYIFDNKYPTLIIPSNGGQLGDINSDGKINSSDALIALRHSVGLITLDGDAARRADVNIDKKINSNDALYILRYSVGLITTFEKG